MEARIFCEWPGGQWMSTLYPDFKQEFAVWIEKYGPPMLVEYRPADGIEADETPPA